MLSLPPTCVCASESERVKRVTKLDHAQVRELVRTKYRQTPNQSSHELIIGRETVQRRRLPFVFNGHYP